MKAITERVYCKLRSEKDIEHSENERNIWMAKPSEVREGVARTIARMAQDGKLKPKYGSAMKYDKYTYGRVYTHLIKGISTPEDYGISPTQYNRMV